MNKKTVAFIITGNHVNQLGSISEDLAGCMVPLLDRPWLQHLVESLISRGIKTFHFFNCDLPQQIEHYFQDGKRWGSEFIYHLGKDEKALLKQIQIQSELSGAEMILLAQTNSIIFDLPDFNEPANICPSAFKVASQADDFYNWHMVEPESLKSASKFDHYKDLSQHLSKHLRGAKWQSISCSRYILLNNPGQLIDAQQQVLNNRFKNILCNANEIDPGIRISRNVTIEPTAVLIPPVFIGENSQIGASAKIGPNACISADCIIDQGTSIEQSCVFPGTYIGEALNIKNSIVNQNQLLNLDINGLVHLSEDFLLGSMKQNWLSSWLSRIFWRLLALVMLIVFSPLLAITAFFKFLFKSDNCLFAQREYIETPSSIENPQIRKYTAYSFSSHLLSQRKRPYHPLAHFLQEFLPGLLAVINGKLSMVGLQPRTEEEFSQLSNAHRKTFLKAYSGLITENQVFFSGLANEQELLAAETLHLNKKSFFYDLSLLFKYFVSFFQFPW
jgi:lipopolysaccharide/colanic/teichoic acid biosynthesis glycosyltransferase/acetyltransferase-like isoleucine patch superfamily enzyme